MSATRIDKELLKADIKKLVESFARDAVDASKTYKGFAYGNQVDKIMERVVSAQHQLLDELMEQKKIYRHNFGSTWEGGSLTEEFERVEAVPVSAIEALKEGLK